jgi:hypothetical protein
MTSKEQQNENLYEWISGILGQILNGYPLQRSNHKLTKNNNNTTTANKLFIKRFELKLLKKWPLLLIFLSM